MAATATVPRDSAAIVAVVVVCPLFVVAPIVCVGFVFGPGPEVIKLFHA